MRIKRISELHQYLIDNPPARERCNKDRASVNILLKRYKIQGDIKEIVRFAREHSSLDREWRDLLLMNESLRGEDYHHKKKLVNAKLRSLGYWIKKRWA